MPVSGQYACAWGRLPAVSSCCRWYVHFVIHFLDAACEEQLTSSADIDELVSCPKGKLKRWTAGAGHLSPQRLLIL